MADIKLEIVQEEELGLTLTDSSSELSMQVKEEEQIVLEFGENGTGVWDYNKAINKPQLNGKELVGNTDETDPTISDWAKSPNKPNYNANEVGAVDVDAALTLQEIDELFKQVFD